MIYEYETTAPTTRRLVVLFGDARQDGRRLVLEDGTDSLGPANYLYVCCDDRQEQRRAMRAFNEASGRPAPLGTWRRYRQDVEAVRTAGETLGWAFDATERALLHELRAYAPAQAVRA